MPVKAAPGLPRNASSLIQPYYYTSSVFVEQVREDISDLVTAFADAYASEPLEPRKPFTFFKKVWENKGWSLVHLRVLDPRGRATFLHTVARLFIERIDPSDNPLIRLGALLALYTFYTVQPRHAFLETLDSIPLTIDTYERLLSFPGALHGPLRLYATYIISQFMFKRLFEILPDSSFAPQNPRTLPHPIVVPLSKVDLTQKRPGPVSQAARVQRAEKALTELETFMATSETRLGSSSSSDVASEGQQHRFGKISVPEGYITKKNELKQLLSPEALSNAQEKTMEQVRQTVQHLKENDISVTDMKGLERLEEACKEPGGLLNLVRRDTDEN